MRITIRAGPKTVVPDATTHPGNDAPVTKTVTKKKVVRRNAHRLQGGPISLFHSEQRAIDGAKAAPARLRRFAEDEAALSHGGRALWVAERSREDETMSQKGAHTAGPPAKKAKSGKIRYVLLASAAIATASSLLVWGAFESTSPPSGLITVWQSPTHACCARWVSYMRARGYAVAVSYADDMSTVKAKLGIPERVRSCHTAKTGDYFIEGHVPDVAIAKLLAERPALKGIALPGMPAGPPGMGGTPGIYRVVGFTAEGHTSYFADVGP